jgi:hypothetical protein
MGGAQRCELHRQAMDSRRTAERNALTALLRSFDLGMDARI